MFEWLEKEFRQIKTNKFHLTEPLIVEIPQYFPQELYLKLPPSYIEFMSKFGWAKLYRSGSAYLINIHPPYQVVSKDGEALIEFAWSDRGGYAYFKTDLLEQNHESPIFEWDRNDDEPELEYGADRFNRWLMKRCRWVRKGYTAEQWQQILAGPPPFTADELLIVAARKQYDWSVVDFAENGDIQIRVKNNSDMTIPYLSLGVSRKDGSLFGGIWLPVKEVLPGQDRIVEHDCYKKYLTPENVEIYQLPDPDPEDRAVYWEFHK